MPFFVIELNGQVVVCAGSAKADVLSASIIGSANGPAVLGASCRISEEDHWVHTAWKSFVLSPRDRVLISFAAEGEPTPSESSGATPKQSQEEIWAEVDRSRSELESRRPLTATTRRQAFSHTRAPRSHHLVVTPPVGESVHSELGDCEQLQAVINLVGSTCKVEVDSLTVQPDGSTRGTRWFAGALQPGEQIGFTYGT